MTSREEALLEDLVRGNPTTFRELLFFASRAWDNGQDLVDTDKWMMLHVFIGHGYNMDDATFFVDI